MWARVSEPRRPAGEEIQGVSVPHGQRTGLGCQDATEDQGGLLCSGICRRSKELVFLWLNKFARFCDLHFRKLIE